MHTKTKRRKIILGILVALNLLSIIVFYGGSVRSYVNTHFKIFAIENVQVKGLTKLSTAEVISHLNISNVSSLIFIDKNKIARSLEAAMFPHVKVMNIKKQYPNTLLLELKEREGKFIMRTRDELVEINERGELIANEEHIRNFDKFYIEWQPNMHGTQWNDEKKQKMLLLFLDLMQKLPEDENDITEIFSAISLGSNYILYSKDENVRVLLGYKLTLEVLRKARYAYLYKKINKIKARTIDIQHEVVKYTL